MGNSGGHVIEMWSRMVKAYNVTKRRIYTAPRVFAADRVEHGLIEYRISFIVW
jgi:hypothetical protein